MGSSQMVHIDGHDVTLTNLSKVLYPKESFTKAQVLDYYQKISPVMLPHLKGRILTMKRYPEGVDKEFFYEKRCPAYRPKWMKTARVKREKKNEVIDFCQVDNLAGIIWVVNLASLEFHTFLSKAPDADRPTMMVFDLDPGEGVTFKDCCRAGLQFRDVFYTMKLKTFPKTSGGKGLHLYIPLNTPVTFDQTKDFSHRIAASFETRDPSRFVSKMSKALRGGKIFIDWSQNDSHKTTVCPYSLRAKDRPMVSTPLDWKEVEACAKGKKDMQFDAQTIIERVKKVGDLFEPVLTLKQKLPALKS
jgi:bifunctional non-homologous end joining protein LigD